jgi:VWFA-related protein
MIASAQQQQQVQARVRVNSDLVTLSVTVRDRDRNLVGNLGRERFRLFDDGVEQKITVFAEESLPLSLVILVDDDLNGKEGVQMVESLRALLGGVSLQDQAMVCRFDMLFYPGDGFTSDLDKLMTEVKKAQGEIKPTPKYIPQPLVRGNSTTGSPSVPAPTYAGSRPSKALDDAVFSAAELLVSTKKSVHIEIVAFTESRPVAFPNHVHSALLCARLFPSPRRSASRDSCSPPSALGPAAFEPSSQAPPRLG